MIDAVNSLRFDPVDGLIFGKPIVERRLSQLDGIFADTTAYKELLTAADDPLIYSVTSVSPVDGDGQLHYGIGKILPGRVGQEYFMTRGHFHEWRVAAEIYIGLGGVGLMLLEDESGQTSQSVELTPNSVIYVPGETAHRTINTGDKPLTYIGIYPAQAGHDYGALAERNFSKVAIAENDIPVLLDRHEFLKTLIQ